MPVKNEEAYEKIIDVSKNNDYTTGNLLDFAYLKKNWLIAIDSRKQTKLKDPQQIILLVSFEIHEEQQCFSSLKNQKKLPLIFPKILSESYE